MTICSVDECGKSVQPKGALGMCSLHYQRFTRHGDVHRAPRVAPPEERFARYVTPGEPDACWEWQGARDANGYGRLNNGANTPLRAHRLAYAMHTGEVLTPDVHIRHTCDNPPCVNPAHLLPGSNADNIADKLARGRQRWNTTGSLGDLTRRLSDADIEAIRASTETATTLAEAYGVTYSYMRRIMTGVVRSAR